MCIRDSEKSNPSRKYFLLIIPDPLPPSTSMWHCMGKTVRKQTQQLLRSNGLLRTGHCCCKHLLPFYRKAQSLTSPKACNTESKYNQMKLLLSHPTGNTFVRALLESAHAAGVLESFHTTIAYRDSCWAEKLLPGGIRTQYERRSCLLYTSPSPRDQRGSRMPSSA